MVVPLTQFETEKIEPKTRYTLDIPINIESNDNISVQGHLCFGLKYLKPNHHTVDPQYKGEIIEKYTTAKYNS